MSLSRDVFRSYSRQELLDGKTRMDLDDVFSLGAFFLCVLGIGVACFWTLGFLYGVLRRPAVWFPFTLALQMAAAAIVGVVFLGFGGVIFSTIIFTQAFRKREDASFWPTAIVGALISIAASAVVLLASYGLAWKIFG